MPATLTLTKAHDGSLRPATADDAAAIARWRVGQGVRVEATQLRPRSLQHHKLYFGGLLELAMQYWEPTGGLIAPAERDTLARFARFLGRAGGNEAALARAAEAFLAQLQDSRAARLESPPPTKAALHRWVKEQAGYADLIRTPQGVARQARSINFNAMDQDEFAEFYRAAFSVVWRFILSRSFADEGQAQQAVDQLVAMG